MKKIISLFKRDYGGNRLVFDEVVEGAEWVIDGEGTPTRKWNGTCCMVRDGNLYRRYTVKATAIERKMIPVGFEPCTDISVVTGKQEGWVPVGWGNQDKWHREALKSKDPFKVDLPDGTYELCGEKVQGNPEKIIGHTLIPHGKDILNDVPRDFGGIKEWFKGKDIEGVVWWHSDGRMVKIKKKDFGLKRSE